MNIKKENLVQEIERKWEVRSPPKNLYSYPTKELIAGYYKNGDGKDVRIRQEGKEFFKVKKSGSGIVRNVGGGDVKITKKEYYSLWHKTRGRRLWKARYYIPLGKLVIEFDVYHDFPGFYTVEVEFKTLEEANKFVPPNWFGRELTNVKGYSSNSLATCGLPDSSR